MDTHKEIQNSEHLQPTDAGQFVEPHITEQLADAGIEASHDSERLANIHSNIAEIHGGDNHLPSVETYSPHPESERQVSQTVNTQDMSSATALDQSTQITSTESGNPAHQKNIVNRLLGNVTMPLSYVAERIKTGIMSYLTKHGNAANSHFNGHVDAKEVLNLRSTPQPPSDESVPANVVQFSSHLTSKGTTSESTQPPEHVVNIGAGKREELDRAA